MFKLNGKQYVLATNNPKRNESTCVGCVAERDSKLCAELPFSCIFLSLSGLGQVYKEAPCSPT